MALRAWAETNATTALFRKFEITSDTYQDAPYLPTDVVEIEQSALLTIAYPLKHRIFDVNAASKDLDDAEDVIREDMNDVHEALAASSNYESISHLATFVESPSIDKGESVWFAEFPMRVRFRQSRFA